jgi:hypothetical protein
MTELLSKLYYDPLTGFQSKDKLYKRAKAQDKSITIQQVKEFLDNQAVAQITKQVKKNKKYETIVSPSVKNNYQMDIMYAPNPSINKNCKYMLTCIDVHSRFVFVKTLPNKTGDLVFHAFKVMMEEYGNPANLNIDMGSEFVYKPFVDYCEKHNIKLWYSNPEQDNKNAIIERFHRTLRNLILRYNVATGKPYIGVLSQLIKNYNTTYHKTVDGIPNDIWTGIGKNNQSYSLIINEFHLGERVRQIVSKEGFGKNSSTNTYSKKIFKIVKVKGHSYFLEGMEKPFREHELIKAVGESIESKYDEKAKEENLKERIKRRLKKEGLI